MARPLSVLLFLYSGFFFALTQGLELTGKISWNNVCPSYKALGPARVVLDNDYLSSSVLKDGSFSIPNVSTGTYVLSVLAHDYTFDQLRIDVIGNKTVEARPYVVGTPLNPPSTVLLSYPITLEAKQKYNYFVPRESFNIMGMLGSPMVLMMIFGGGMVFAMPYLMKNMDPESLAEFKEQQAKMAQMQNAMATGDFKSGLSALMQGPEDNKPAQPASQAVTGRAQGSGGKGRGNKGKRH